MEVVGRWGLIWLIGDWAKLMIRFGFYFITEHRPRPKKRFIEV